MNVDKNTIEEIITACKTDTRLFSVVQDIYNKTPEERYEIRRKASALLSNVNKNDKEALKFYYIITDDKVLEEVMRRLINGE